MRIIGLTGGICAGKSGITRYLLKKGFPVIDCDKITDELYNYTWFTEGLKQLFGNKILYNKEVNRGRLGSLVFSDMKEMQRLNDYCKPFIFQEVERQLQVLMNEGYEFIFIDAPVLFESGLQNVIEFTDIWVVSVTQVEQIRRLKQRKPYLSSKSIHNILGSQLTNQERIENATYVIENNVKDRMLLYNRVDRGLRLLGATIK